MHSCPRCARLLLAKALTSRSLQNLLDVPKGEAQGHSHNEPRTALKVKDHISAFGRVELASLTSSAVSCN